MKAPPDRLYEYRERLRARGYRIIDDYVNHRGQLLLVITGPGLYRFALFLREVVALSEGRITASQLLARRRAKPGS